MDKAIELYKKFNLDIYSINTICNNNNLIIVDNDNYTVIRETNLIKVYEIAKDKNIKLMYELLMNECQEFKPTNDLLLIKKILINNQKTLFHIFKDLVLMFKNCIHSYKFIPINKRIIIEDGIKYFNMYTHKNSFNGIKPNINSKFYHIEVLMKNILQDGYEHFIKFLAWKIKYPEIIIPNHWIIQDDGGTGKTEILANHILDKLFNISIITQDDLEDNFTDYMQNSTIIIAEEIEGFSNEKKMKALTGAKTVRINDKFKTKFTIKNYNNWILFSNDIKPLKIGIHDRRFNVVGGGLRLVPINKDEWEKTLFKSEAKFKDFFKGFDSNIENEIKSLYSYLQALKIDRTELQIPINNKRKNDLLEINYTSEHEFINELVEIGLHQTVINYYSKTEEYFYRTHFKIIDKNNYITCNGIYDLYKNYSKECNLKTISKNHFFRRLKNIDSYNTMFNEYSRIYIDNIQVRVIKIKKNEI